MMKVRKYLLPMLVIVLGGFSAHAEELDISKFTWMVQFTASGYDGESTLTNFPALVRLSDEIPGFHYSDIGDTTNAAYASLRFADVSGNCLDYEIETWDTNGTSFVWVSIPELSGIGTKFFACYMPVGGYALPNVYPTNVWISAGYVGVWHLNNIIKNYANGYKAYNDQLWGHVFPDSTGRGANATKGTTSWDTSLLNAPNQASGSQAFPESNGRANGTLGAHGYTPFAVPPTADGGGAGDWNFSVTGYSTETWIYPQGGRSILASSQSVGSDGKSADNFIHVTTAGARIAGNGWGGSTMQWDSGSVTETDSWHFVTTVWTPASSANNSVLYGSNGNAAPRAMDSKDYHATDQFMTDGMNLGAGSGSSFGVDEVRVRRGLSTPDWIQANWDTQRVGTDFLEVGIVHDPTQKISHGLTRIIGTPGCSSVTLADSIEFDETVADPIPVKLVISQGGSVTTNDAGSVSSASPDVEVTRDGLLPGVVYEVWFSFVFEGRSYDSIHASFTTAALPAPVISAVGTNTATASGVFLLVGDEYANGSAKAVFVNFATKNATEFSIADLANPSVVATGLSADTDYDVCFVIVRDDNIMLESPVASFATMGRPTLNPKDYRCSVVFTTTGYDGVETLDHFPALVHLSETDVSGFSYEGVDPAKIRFAAADGSLIPHEIETWDPTGLSTIWVGLPVVSGTDTTFKMYWKPLANAGVAAQPVYRVWKYAGYVGVWHAGDTISGVAGRQLEDSSGYGMNTTNYAYYSGQRTPLILTNAVKSANGSAWFRHRNSYWDDVSTDDRIRFGVTPEQTANWNFSKTGYSVETWARPAWLDKNDHVAMFCTSLNPDNTSNYNSLNALCVRNDRAGFECNWKTYIKSNAWSDEETNQWHYVAAVWAAAGSGDASVCYEARADIAAGTLRTLVSSTEVEACDFAGRHMGFVGGNPPPRTSGYMSYQVDEMRVRRGRSSEAWIQANWDTQRLGTDFLTAGEVKTYNPAFIIIVR